MEIEDRLKQIEEEIKKTPYHKGTEHHIGKLRAKIAKLKEEQISKMGKSSSGGGGGFAVRKSGDATVILLGPPSVGKSTLINQLTNAQSKVAAYDFTTIDVIPGMMDYMGAKIQIFDVPGIISGAAQGKGRGKKVLSVVRSADLVIIMIDYKSLAKIKTIKEELYSFGIRLDETRPNISIAETDSGGVKINHLSKLSHLSLETIKEIAQEFKLRNGEITTKEDLTLTRLIDAFMGNRLYLPYLVVVNKIDQTPHYQKNKDFIFISAKKKTGLEELKKRIWESLNLIRIYLKREKGETDKANPLIAKKNLSLKEILKNISFPDKERIIKAQIYGPGAKFPGQEVSLNFQPQDETIVTFLSS